MLDKELYTGKMAVLGCHNQWSLGGREEGGDGRREKRERDGRREKKEREEGERRGREKRESEERERSKFQLVVHMFEGLCTCEHKNLS